MYNIEKNVDLNLNNFIFPIVRGLFKYKLGEKYLMFMDPESNILFNEQSLWGYEHGFQTANFYGGVICDEVGLGKTLSMVCLMLQNPLITKLEKIKPKIITLKKKITAVKKIQPKIGKKDLDKREQKEDKKDSLNNGNENKTNSDENKKDGDEKINDQNDKVDMKGVRIKPIPLGIKWIDGLYHTAGTIILCPSRLCQQWEDEIDKYLKPEIRSNFKIIKITTKPQLEKQTYESICEADLVIVSYPFLSNKNYWLNQDRIKLDRIHWHRVIIDEGHEVLLPQARRQNEVKTASTILNLPSTYRWCCTGDPLARNSESMEGIISFLTKNKQFSRGKEDMLPNLTKDIGMKVIKEYFHRNTKKSTKDQIYIPKVQENIEFLEFSPTERAVYNNAKGDQTRMMQLCTNILISDYHSNIIGNRVVNMNEINEAMCEHFKETANELKGKIIANQTAEEEMDIKFPIELDDLENRIKIYTNKLKKKIPLTVFEEEDLKELKENRTKLKAGYNYRKKAFAERLKNLNAELEYTYGQIKLFTGLNIDKITKEPCPICQEKFKEVIITKCGHIFCQECFNLLFNNSKKYANCPFCREHMLVSDMKKAEPTKEKTTEELEKETVGEDGEDVERGDDVGKIKNVNDPDTDKSVGESLYKEILDRWGTKMSHLIRTLNKIFEDPTNRVIIFSQWNRMLYMVGNVLEEAGIQHVFCRGNIFTITKSIGRFKKDPAIRVIMLSSETCSSGNNLTEASHVVLLDTVNTSRDNALAIENQAIGRAVRLGQKKSVQVIRMIIKDTVEEEHYNRNYKQQQNNKVNAN